jgi:hypothetical protein
MRRWTLGSAVGIGASAGLLALILWPFFAEGEIVSWLLLTAACVAGLCGGWVVVATMVDITFHRPRGERLRPIRAFDLLLGSGLFLLAYLQIRDAFGMLDL